MLRNVILKSSVTRMIIMTSSEVIDSNLSVRKTAFWEVRMCNLILMFVILNVRFNKKIYVTYNTLKNSQEEYLYSA